jgi:trk system potassium uptake protein
MDFRVISKLLGIVILLIGASMAFSLPWASPRVGYRQAIEPRAAEPRAAEPKFESRGFFALVGSMAICGLVGGVLLGWGRHSQGHLYRKEALAVVGLSWILATVMGALPFCLSGTLRCPAVRLSGPEAAPLHYRFGAFSLRSQWEEVPRLSAAEYAVIAAIQAAGAAGLSPEQLGEITDVTDAPAVVEHLLTQEPRWRAVMRTPEADASDSAAENYRLRWVAMGLTDACFEAQSGFSTTGASVIVDLEDPELVPHCILFWRSTTHFLGGLGIIVLFVSLLGGGTVAKALMRAEMAGPTKEGATERMQQTAWLFAAVYVGLNMVLAIILNLAGLSLFDALCHAFGTMATGGFSTYNASVGHFAKHPQLYSSAAIESAIVVFMILAGTSFTLLYLCLMRKPGRLLADVEWRAYIAIMAVASLSVMLYGWLQTTFQACARPFGTGPSRSSRS